MICFVVPLHIWFWWLLRIYKDGHLLTWVLLKLHFSALEILMKYQLDADHSKHLQLQNLFSSPKLMKNKNPQNWSCLQMSCFFGVYSFLQHKTWILNFRKICRVERDCDIVCVVLWKWKFNPSSSNSKHHFNSVWGKVSLLLNLFPQQEELLPEHSGSFQFIYIFGEQTCHSAAKCLCCHEMSLVGNFSACLYCYGCRVTHVIFENTM